MKYEKPELEIIAFDEKDIVTTSMCVGMDQIDICLIDGDLQ